MAKGQKILVVSESPETLSLLNVLLSEAGYRVKTLFNSDPVLSAARQFGPDLIVVELLRGNGEELALLDHLRTGTDTRGVLVVAIGPTPEVLQRAVASYNVNQVVLEPFDLPDLEAKVRDALEHSSLLASLKRPSAPPPQLYGDVATELALRSRLMMIRWVQRIAASEPYRGRNLGLASLIDHVPLLLEAVVLALQAADFRVVMAKHPEILERTAEHARTRIKQGIPLSAIVVEYLFLREEIRCETAGILAAKGRVTSAETLDLAARQDYALDTILRTTAQVYEREVAK